MSAKLIKIKGHIHGASDKEGFPYWYSPEEIEAMRESPIEEMIVRYIRIENIPCLTVSFYYHEKDNFYAFILKTPVFELREIRTMLSMIKDGFFISQEMQDELLKRIHIANDEYRQSKKRPKA